MKPLIAVKDRKGTKKLITISEHFHGNVTLHFQDGIYQEPGDLKEKFKAGEGEQQIDLSRR